MDEDGEGGTKREPRMAGRRARSVVNVGGAVVEDSGGYRTAWKV